MRTAGTVPAPKNTHTRAHTYPLSHTLTLTPTSTHLLPHSHRLSPLCVLSCTFSVLISANLLPMQKSATLFGSKGFLPRKRQTARRRAGGCLLTQEDPEKQATWEPGLESRELPCPAGVGEAVVEVNCACTGWGVGRGGLPTCSTQQPKAEGQEFQGSLGYIMRTCWNK